VGSEEVAYEYEFEFELDKGFERLSKEELELLIEKEIRERAAQHEEI
jgi:hypothetical protein